jgi:ABC-2 type transport system ATP-binding protein
VLRERVEAGVPVVFSSHQLELVERLCEAVAIISDGRVVATGDVGELRDRERRRAVRVEVDGAGEAWTDGIPGVEEVTDSDGGLILTLSEDADDQAVLDAARRAGRVRHFGAVRPTLAEIFREAVA